jgi:hypothetical protein
VCPCAAGWEVMRRDAAGREPAARLAGGVGYQERTRPSDWPGLAARAMNVEPLPLLRLRS